MKAVTLCYKTNLAVVIGKLGHTSVPS